MTTEEIERLQDDLEKWDTKQAKQGFIHKMEKKLARKERSG